MELILDQWRRELPELDVSSMAVFGRLARVSHRAAARVEPVFTGHGLTRGEFDVLAALRRSGSPFRLTPTALSHGLMLSSGGMTKRLDRLAASGLVRRIANPDDRRGSLIELTPTGRRVLEDTVFEAQTQERSLIAGMPERDRRELARLLASLSETLEGSVGTE